MASRSPWAGSLGFVGVNARGAPESRGAGPLLGLVQERFHAHRIGPVGGDDQDLLYPCPPGPEENLRPVGVEPGIREVAMAIDEHGSGLLGKKGNSRRPKCRRAAPFVKRRPAHGQTGSGSAFRLLRARSFSLDSPVPQRVWISRRAGDATKMEE